jgi:hypothetical protein
MRTSPVIIILDALAHLSQVRGNPGNNNARYQLANYVCVRRRRHCIRKLAAGTVLLGQDQTKKMRCGASPVTSQALIEQRCPQTPYWYRRERGNGP